MNSSNFKHRYSYKAKVVSVYDGDTFKLNIDLGYGITIKGPNGKGEPVRLARINTPETRGPEKNKGIEVRDYVRKLIDGQDVFIETKKDYRGKYGRYIAEVYFLFSSGDGGDMYVNLTDHLLDIGLGKEF